MENYLLKKTKKLIVDLLFPIQCINCEKEGNFICLDCFNRIPINKKPPMQIKDSYLNGIIVSSYYDNIVKQAIYRYKYDFAKKLSEPLGMIMSEKLLQIKNINYSESFLIPVPLHKKRLKWRGFNQSLLLAEEIGKRLKIPVNNDILIRKKYSLPQVKIENAKERRKNIKESFCINPDFNNNLKNKTIILIDDISTTGATLEECAKTLKELNPKSIWALVISQG